MFLKPCFISTGGEYRTTNLGHNNAFKYYGKLRSLPYVGLSIFVEIISGYLHTSAECHWPPPLWIRETDVQKM